MSNKNWETEPSQALSFGHLRLLTEARKTAMKTKESPGQVVNAGFMFGILNLE